MVENYNYKCYLKQRSPTTFDLRTILQKRDNSWATSNTVIYTATHSQHLKLKKGR